MKENSRRKKLLLGSIAIALLSLVIYWADAKAAADQAGRVSRQGEAAGPTEQTFAYELGNGMDGQLTLQIQPVEREAREAMALLEEARTEWQKNFLGENPDAEHVWHTLILPDTMLNGLVNLTYESSDYAVVNPDGTVHWDKCQSNDPICLRVTYRYREYEQIEEEWIRVVMPPADSQEWVEWKLRTSVIEEENSKRSQKEFILPEQVEGLPVVWKKGRNDRWIYVVLLGLAALLAYSYKEKEEERKRKEDRAQGLEYEYPQMVDQMSLLLGSGMTIRGAWEQILRTDRVLHENGVVEDRYFIEEMKLTFREIREGIGERDAYDRFGSRIGSMPYRRFSAILTQNLSKGNRDVRALLAEETRMAMDMRKNLARRRGEEAGTKLLFPMLLMLLMILIILLLPAIRQF